MSPSEKKMLIYGGITVAAIGGLWYFKNRIVANADKVLFVANSAGEYIGATVYDWTHAPVDNVTPTNAIDAQKYIVLNPSSFMPDVVAKAKTALTSKGIALPQPGIFDAAYWNPANWQI